MAVSPSGYAAWKKRAPSRRRQENVGLLEQIRALYQESDQTYGSPRMHRQLQKRGVACSENRVARLMRLEGLCAKAPRRFVVTTQTDPHLPVAENVLDRQFTAPAPNTRWSGDITYVWT